MYFYTYKRSIKIVCFCVYLKVTADKLREHFSVKGIVTDVQLKYTKDGRFRHFGFVGFQTEEQAEAALSHFNNTFINTSKITVELCADLGKYL